MSTVCTLSRSPQKRKEPRHGHFEVYVSETMPVEYEMRRYSTEVNAYVVFKKNNRLPPTVGDSILKSPKSTLARLLRSAFMKRAHWANVFITVEEVKFLRTIAWGRGPYQYSKEQYAEAEEGGFFWARTVSM